MCSKADFLLAKTQSIACLLASNIYLLLIFCYLLIYFTRELAFSLGNGSATLSFDSITYLLPSGSEQHDVLPLGILQARH